MDTLMTDESAGQQANADAGDQSQQQTGGADGNQQQAPEAQADQGRQKGSSRNRKQPGLPSNMTSGHPKACSSMRR